jgi:ribulose-5-phosphate 4-epimerase/fuculose-1-phosphate aldolase
MTAEAPLTLVEATATTEREVRVELAACYRIVDLLGWTELIFNHITAKVPGPEKHFLINPFGLLYSEVTASNLVKIDLDGAIVGDSDHPVNAAGFIIHGAIHRARPDVHCILHTHTTSGVAVACLEAGLTQTNFYSALIDGAVAYHDFEGVTTRPDECDRLVASLGQKNLMILRNHGLLSCGRTIAEAFVNLWRLQRACDIQVAAASAATATDGGIIPVSPEAAFYSSSSAGKIEHGKVDERSNEPAAELKTAARVFNALRRRIDAIDSSYRD